MGMTIFAHIQSLTPLTFFSGNPVHPQSAYFNAPYRVRLTALYLISGEGFITLDKGDMLALRTIKSQNVENAELVLQRMNKDTAENRARAIEVLRWGANPLGK